MNELGEALSPHALTSRWVRMLKAAGVRHIRFHDARHTCGTLMHLQDVPIALISAWLGHASKAFTMATYVHSQPEALAAAAQSFAKVVENGTPAHQSIGVRVASGGDTGSHCPLTSVADGNRLGLSPQTRQIPSSQRRRVRILASWIGAAANPTAACSAFGMNLM